MKYQIMFVSSISEPFAVPFTFRAPQIRIFFQESLFQNQLIIIFLNKGLPNMILVKVKCYVNVENHFLTFIKHITFTRIMFGAPLIILCRKKVFNKKGLV